MRKFLVLGLAFSASLTAFAASSSTALAKEFLFNGAKLVESLPGKAVGELDIQDLGLGDLIGVSFVILGTWDLIIFLFDGFMFLNETMEGQLVTGTYIQKGSCEGTTTDVVGLHLPWNGELSEVSAGVYRMEIGEGETKAGLPGFEIECLVLGIAMHDVCTGDTSALMENMAEGLLVVFDAESAKLNCTVGGMGEGDLTTPSGGGLLASATEATVAVS